MSPETAARVAREDAATAHCLTQIRKALASLERGMITDDETVWLIRGDLAKRDREAAA